MEFFHSWQDFFTFDRKEIARFFQDATAFMDGFHGSFAAEELYAAAAFIAVEADDLDTYSPNVVIITARQMEPV